MSDREWISAADTAKLVRKALKSSFPGVKFSVRTSTYAGGASIRVRWLDGPTVRAVEAVTGHYSGATFDGMVDLKSYHDTVLQGPDGPRTVHFGADFIFTDREYSPTFLQMLLWQVGWFWGGPELASEFERLEIKTYDDGSAHCVSASNIRLDNAGPEYLDRLLHREAPKVTWYPLTPAHNTDLYT